MSALSDIVELIRDTHAQISSVESEIITNPQERGLRFNLSSLQKRLLMLESRFAEITDKQMIDVCDYRIYPNASEKYPVLGVGSALVNFQWMVTVFFDAVKNGPKTRARVNPETEALSTMDFSYCYSGSLGITMVIPNERLIAVDSDLDMAIENTFQVINSTQSADIAVLAKKCGVAAIRSVYAWSKKNADYGMSAAIEWKRGKAIRNEAYIAAEQMERLATLISATSENEQISVNLSGKLVGIDQILRTFHLQMPEGEEIKGKLSESFTFDKQVPIPSHVNASLTKFTKIYYSTEKEEVSWVLHAAQPN